MKKLNADNREKDEAAQKASFQNRLKQIAADMPEEEAKKLADAGIGYQVIPTTKK